MAKKVYVGINNITQKVKKIYIGINGVAKKIKKAYIGIGGVARLFWGLSGEVEYYGTATPLSAGRNDMMGANNNYAIFAGGITSRTYSDAYAYNSNLVQSQLDPLSYAKYKMASENIGNYVLFAGGITQSGANEIYRKSIDVYDNALVHSTYDMPIAVKGNAATSLDNYVIIAGGETNVAINTNKVYAYNASMVSTALDDLASARVFLKGAHTKNYAIFNPGGNGSGVVDFYSKTLVHTSRTDGNNRGTYSYVSRGYANLPDYALFYGYNSDATKRNLADVYNDNLVMSTLSLGSGRIYESVSSSSGITFDDGVLISGLGTNRNNTIKITNNLVVSELTSIQYGRNNMASAHVGDYALLAGGYNTADSSIVEAYHFI